MRPFFKNIKNRFNNTAEAIAMPAFSTEYFELISFFKEISSRIKSSEGMLKLLKKLLKPIKFTYWENSIMYEDRLGYKVNVYIPRETSHRIIKIIARILKDYSVKEIFEIMAQAFDLNNLRDIDLSGVQKKVSDFEIGLKDRWSKVRAFGKDHLRKTKEKTEKLSIKKLKEAVLKWLDDASDYVFREDGFNYSEVYEGTDVWMNPFEIELQRLNESFDFDKSSSVDDEIEYARTLMRQRYGNFLEYKNMVFETVQTLIKTLYPTYKTKSSEETISKIDDVLNYIFNFSIDVNDRVFKFNAYYDECDLFEIIEKSYGIPSEENVVFSGYFMKCLEDFFNYFFEEISSPSGQDFKEALDKEVKVFRKNFEKAKMKGFL